MNIIKGVLTAASKTGGIKIDNGFWINPSNSNKTNILKNLEKIKSWRNKIVNIELDSETTYIGIVIDDEIQRITQTENIKNTSQETKLSEIINKDYLINLKGKEFITFAGLLDISHKQGLAKIETELVTADFEKNIFVTKAKVTTKKGVFEGIGDSTPENVGKLVGLHGLRMSETRAIARALRWATNIGMTALEEIGEIEHKPEK